MFELQATDLRIKRTTEKEDEGKVKAQEIAIQNLGAELAAEKIKGMTKDTAIKNFGGEIASLKLDIMKLKGGAK